LNSVIKACPNVFLAMTNPVNMIALDRDQQHAGPGKVYTMAAIGKVVPLTRSEVADGERLLAEIVAAVHMISAIHTLITDLANAEPDRMIFVRKAPELRFWETPDTQIFRLALYARFDEATCQLLAAQLNLQLQVEGVQLSDTSTFVPEETTDGPA